MVVGLMQDLLNLLEQHLYQLHFRSPSQSVWCIVDSSNVRTLSSEPFSRILALDGQLSCVHPHVALQMDHRAGAFFPAFI